MVISYLGKALNSYAYQKFSLTLFLNQAMITTPRCLWSVRMPLKKEK